MSKNCLICSGVSDECVKDECPHSEAHTRVKACDISFCQNRSPEKSVKCDLITGEYVRKETE